jgi:polysaccharide biosynthesis transport protein
MSTVNETGLIRAIPYEPAILAADAGAHAAPAGSVTFADAWRVLKQRKSYVIGFFLLAYVLIAGAFFAVRQWYPAWPSEAVLEFRPPKSATSGADEYIPPETMRLQVETEARKIRQPNVFEDVLKQAQVKETNYYKSFSSLAEAREDLLDEVAVNPVPDTRLIRVRLALAKPSEAQLIVRMLVDRYTQSYEGYRKGDVKDTLEQIKTTVAAKKDELTRKREEKTRFQQSKNISAMEEEKSITAERLAALRHSLDELQAQEAELQSTRESVQGLKPGELPITAEMRSTVEADPDLRYLKNQAEQLEIQIEAMKQNMLGEKHKSLLMLKSQLDLVRARESQRREELIDTLRERQLDSLNQDIAKARAMEAQLFTQIADAETRQHEVDSALSQFRDYQTEEQRLEDTISDLTKQQTAAEQMVGSQASTGRLELIQPASLATKMSRPSPALFFGGGFAAALLIGIGVAFLREFTDKAVRTPIDVARFARLPVLGAVPKLDDEEADIETIEHATRRAPHSLVAEAFRHVRAHLLFSGPIESQRVLLITSPGASDGKTSVAINLAVTLAQSNQRVLLIDANFRRPAIRRAFNGTRNEGLSNVLIGQGKWESYVTKTDMPTLDVMCSGPLPPAPAELLGSKYMRDLLQEARTKYDRVIIDAPPALLISDSLVIATQVDGVILVARAVANSKGSLRRAREQLEKIGARIVGAILNGAEASPGGYFRRQYREFYDYVADDEPELRELPAVAGASKDGDDDFEPPRG